MIRAELERAKESKSREIQESELIERCKEFALLGRMVDKKERDASTYVKWRNLSSGLTVVYEDGIHSMGTGTRISVESYGEEVFLCVDESIYQERPDQHALRVGEFFVLKYSTKKSEHNPVHSWEEMLSHGLEEVTDSKRAYYRRELNVPV